MRIRKLEEVLQANTNAYLETLEAIKCYQKAPVPKGLYVYRNELDVLIGKQTKELEHWKKPEGKILELKEENVA